MISAILLLTLFEFSSFGQNLIIRGIINDAHSDERIPFASMSFKNSGQGRLSDSAGNFVFRFHEWPSRYPGNHLCRLSGFYFTNRQSSY